MLWLVLFIAAVIWWLYQRQSRTSLRPVNKRAARQVRGRVIRQLNGDAKAADRLFAKVRLRYPERSEQWQWEKVLFDLERDRRC